MIRLENGYMCSRCFTRHDSDESLCPVCGYDESYSSVQDSVKTGTVLNGRFLLGSVIRRDIMGFTYAALDRETGKRVQLTEYFPQGITGRDRDGVTVLPEPDWESVFESGIDTFHREAVFYGLRTSVPNVVHTLGFFTSGTACCVSEYGDGSALSEYTALHGGALEPDAAKILLTPLADTLDTLHRGGHFHGDVCPENIIVNQGTCLLTGFGETKSAIRRAVGIRSMLDAPKGMDESANDIRLLALTLYCIITGQPMDGGGFDPDSPDMRGVPENYALAIKNAVRGGIFNTAADFLRSLDIPAAAAGSKRSVSGKKNEVKLPEWIKDRGETMTISSSEVKNYVNQHKDPPKPVQEGISSAELRRSEKELAGKRKKMSRSSMTAALLSMALLAVIAVFALGGAFSSGKNKKPDIKEPESETNTEETKPEENSTSTQVIIPEISFIDGEISLKVGDEYKPEVRIKPEEAKWESQILYSSADPDIVKADERGIITAAAPGETEITAQIEYDGRVYKAKLKVKAEKIPAELYVDQDYVNLPDVGASAEIGISANYDWTVENPMPWLKVEYTDSGIRVSADRNIDEPRGGELSVICEDITVKIYVNQPMAKYMISDLIEIEFDEFVYHRMTGYVDMRVKVTNVGNAVVDEIDWTVSLRNDRGVSNNSRQDTKEINLKPGETDYISWHGFGTFNSAISFRIDLILTGDTLVRDGKLSLDHAFE